jgi:hypothetical protein
MPIAGGGGKESTGNASKEPGRREMEEGEVGI